MNFIVKTKSIISTLLILVGLIAVSSCKFEYELPEEGSIADLTPPTANFSAAQSEADFLMYSFSNLSVSATTYAWNFGDGNSSTEKEPVNTYPAEGDYTVTLTASDKLGQTSTFSLDISVVEPEAPAAITPVVLEADFEDLSLPDGTGDGRDSWRNDFGGVIQITSSPVQSGSQAAKFPSAGDRVAYQEGIAVSPNTDYVLTYYYTLKTSNNGSITLSVIGEGISNLSEVSSKKLADHVGTDQTSANDYVQVDLAFNTGANTSIAILITNEGEEARLDNISIAAVE